MCHYWWQACIFRTCMWEELECVFNDKRIHYTEKHHGLNVQKVSELWDLNENLFVLKIHLP